MDHWIDLLNSDWHDYRGSGRRADHLDDPAWRARYLARWGRRLAGVPVTEVVDGLKRLRTVLRRAVDAVVADRPVPEQERRAINAVLAAAPAVHRLDRDGSAYALRDVPQGQEPAAVLAEIAAGFAAVLAEGEPERIKICQNVDCRWVFFDRSKNRSRRWCENDTACGTLMKVRRFRARRKKG
jgi:predicted RNA-binding Zn ribbon-like protein